MDSYQGDIPEDIQEGTLRLTETMCWIIQTTIRPGLTDTGGIPHSRAQFVALGLRQKINDALLRFTDETDLKIVDIAVDADECWLIDSQVSFDGRGGPGMELLTQCFRILWGLKYQLPIDLVAEPAPEPPTPEPPQKEEDNPFLNLTS